MAGLNNCCFIGNLGRDPEIRNTQSGDKIVHLSIGCSETWKDKQTGERKERTEWIPIVIFNKGLATVAEKYLRKGSKVYVSGKFQTRKWQDQNGNDRYSTEIVIQNFGGELLLLDSNKNNQNNFEEENSENQDYSGWDEAPTDLDDAVPF